MTSGLIGTSSRRLSFLEPVPATLSSRSDSEEAFKIVKEWIHVCNHNHPDCKSSKKVVLPSRVIDVGRRSWKTPTVKLFVPNAGGADGKHDTQYIALSHCWGSKKTFTTKTTTLSQRCRGIDWSELPKTFQGYRSLVHSTFLQRDWSREMGFPETSR